MSSPGGLDIPTRVAVAQTVGVTASLYLLGSNAALSLVSVPAILQAPAPLAAKQWFTILNRGGAIGRSLAIISALATAYAAYKHTSTTQRNLNIAATILVPSIVPFTYAFIVPTNNKLIAKKDELAAVSLDDKAVEANITEGETVHALIDHWALLNLARAGLIAAGSLCAVLAVVTRPSKLTVVRALFRD